MTKHFWWTSHLNSLNARFQGKDKQFTNLCDDISAFKVKLRLFIGQLTGGTLGAFPTLKTFVVERHLTCYRLKWEFFWIFFSRDFKSSQ